MDSFNDDLSNDEPEEVSKKVSESKAKEFLKQEKIAFNVFQEKLKERRRQKLERNIEQKQRKLDIERLPIDLFDQIEKDFDTKKKSYKILHQEPEEIKNYKKKNEKLTKNKLLETLSTRYQVLAFDELNGTKAPISQTAACNFREQVLYNNKRNKRILSRQFISNLQKRRAYKK